MLNYKVIMKHLLNGGKVAPKDQKEFRGFYIGISDKPYIRYNNHGSSAVQVNYENLEWLVNTIFNGLDSLELKDKDYFVYA